MSESVFPENSLVIYKKRPARVINTFRAIEIELENGTSLKVRAKDIHLLHPGPILDIRQLQSPSGDVQTAWQMLLEENNCISFKDLTELVFGVFSPSAAWAAWLILEDGLYFHGDFSEIHARSEAFVQKEIKSRQEKAQEAQVWSDFLIRARSGKLDLQTDFRFLRETEDLAFGRRTGSRLLRELGRSERPESAHAALLEWKYWDEQVNPHPVRLAVPLNPPQITWKTNPGETRKDLTDLQTYAIDDRENTDPDDAISLISCLKNKAGEVVGGKLWVHVADPASVITPNSPLDKTARERGTTVYLPDHIVPMLPLEAIQDLALGLSQISPALSFELELNEKMEPRLLRFLPSLIQVQRISYEEAEQRLEQEPFNSLRQLTQAYTKRRLRNGALSIDLPEILLKVEDGLVNIRPLPRLISREIVREAMLMVGEAIAAYAVQNNIPFPFTTQEYPVFPDSLIERQRPPTGLESISGCFTIRRFLKRSQTSLHPGVHAGLGLPIYSRITSPLRRYHDLIAHQQLRRQISGLDPSDEQTLLHQIAEAEEPVLRASQAESLSRRHWTLVFLIQNPGWEGEGVLVEKNGMSGMVILPELALETRIQLRDDLPEDSRIRLRFESVNLPELEAKFKILDHRSA